MIDKIYKVTDDTDEIYYVDDPSSILDTFGKVFEVIEYDLMNPKDITDDINGDYDYEQ